MSIHEDTNLFSSDTENFIVENQFFEFLNNFIDYEYDDNNCKINSFIYQEKVQKMIKNQETILEINETHLDINLNLKSLIIFDYYQVNI